jgi:hypothetical protein
VIDIGLLTTGLFAAACLGWGRSVWLSRVLFAGWVCGAAISMAGATKSQVVLGLALTDMVIAITALFRFTQDCTNRAAQTVGFMSLALMPAHSIMAATHGGADWTIYVSAVNAIFVLQCLTAGGWLDGVGRGIAGIWGRMRPVRTLRDRGR